MERLMHSDAIETDRAFREEVQNWLHDNIPRTVRPTGGPDMREFDLEWQRAQWGGGWAGVGWPTAVGGRGASLLEQMIWHEEYASFGAPPVGACFVGLNHLGPTLIDRASTEQQRDHLPPVLRGEVVWCQGFSEPDAGSDLAALRTTAIIDGDELVIDGQKVWTSYAHLADWQQLLVRTDPTVEKHCGLTCVLCDMRSPGITVRPLRTMANTEDFAEVFYEAVRVPMANVVGGFGDGWSIALATLAYERGTAFTADQVELAIRVDHLIDAARTVTGPDGLRPAIAHEDLAVRLATARAEVIALRAMTYAGVSRIQRDGVPGPETSLIRLFYVELAQRVARLAMDVFGPRGLEARGHWTHEFLQSFSYSIGGGTSEVQRNIIGERVLALPR